MRRERLSAIVPGFNGAHFLSAALNSMLSQTRLPDEIMHPAHFTAVKRAFDHRRTAGNTGGPSG